MKKKKEHLIHFGLVTGSEGETDFRERKSDFSLDFSAFGPSVLVRAKGEVGLFCKGYAWTPILWSFDNSGR